jgi:tetratricopeptide (TPR) repeat protein
MIRRDYIIRMVAEFAQALARIRERRDRREYAEAGEALDEAFLELVGTGAESVSQLTETQLLAKLTLDEPTHVLREKSLMLVTLLDEAGQLYAVQEREAESRTCRLKALDLLLTLQLRDADFELPDFVPRIDMLRTQLSDSPLPLRTQAGLWRHYERIGDYAKAEDALFAILEGEPANANLISEAGAFYERLKRQSDSALEAGNLPRKEVEMGLAQIRDLKLL